jgi:hypothetical protein
MPNNPNRALTTFHEIGNPRVWESVVEDGSLEEWREVVLVSRAVEYLAYQSIEDDMLIAEVAEGALEWPELWARSYAQYVLNRTRERDLVSQLDAYRIPRTGGIYLPLQWDDDDFVAIDLAIEKVFPRLGWRNE